MKRREFLKSAAITGSLFVTGCSNFTQNTDSAGKDISKEPAMKGFIVADAHFGWEHPAQPSNETIAQAIGVITQNFPDLDVFIDTGDIHHGNADDQARGDWTDVIPGSIGLLPFYLAAGNHEIVTFRGGDTEKRTMRVGSIACRPYYSFDMKGIHFVCLPELINPNLITSEEMLWLKFDLDLSTDKTTIILTHNSLADTTSYHDSKTYRRVANSDQIHVLLKSYPNVLAWMHGHNHTWELVEKNEKFYVSNGRIGGFASVFNNDFRHHIGGIYFEIGKNYFTVKAYDATAEEFFDAKPGYEHLSKTMNVKTSFNPNAPASVSWGMGGSRDGQKISAYQYHLPAEKGNQNLIVTGVDDPVFSENQDMTINAEQTEGWSKGRSVPGISIHPKKDLNGEIDGIRFLEDGIELLPLGKDQTSRSIFSPKNGAYYEYYQCAPGRTYNVSLKTKADKSLPKCSIIFRLYDNEGNIIFEKSGKSKNIKTNKTTIQDNVTIPKKFKDFGMYGDESSSKFINLAVEAKINDLTVPVQVYSFDVKEQNTNSVTKDVKIKIAGNEYKFNNKLRQGDIKKFNIKNNLHSREVIEINAAGSGRATWMVKKTGLKWQVRNAPAEYLPDGSIEVGPMRNTFSDKYEVIIVPLTDVTEPYVHRMQGINKCRIEPYDKQKKEMRIHVEELIGDYHDIKILNAPGAPSAMINVGHRNYETFWPDSVGVEVKEEGTVIIRF